MSKRKHKASQSCRQESTGSSEKVKKGEPLGAGDVSGHGPRHLRVWSQRLDPPHDDPGYGEPAMHLDVTHVARGPGARDSTLPAGSRGEPKK